MPTFTIDNHIEILHKNVIISEVINKLIHFVQIHNTKPLFIIGDYCRCTYLNDISDIESLDIVSAFPEYASYIGSVFFTEILQIVPLSNEKDSIISGVYETEYGSINIQFQGSPQQKYINSHEIQLWMNKNNVDNTPLMRHVYEQLFTIDALIYDLSDTQMYDPSVRAKFDFQKHIIDTLLPPALVVKYCPLLILKALYFSLKYNFSINSDLRHVIERSSQNLLKHINKQRLLDEIVKIIKIDAVKAIDMLKRYNLHYVLHDKEIINYLGTENGS